MATSSITKNFVIDNEEDAQMFLDAIEASIEYNRQKELEGGEPEVHCRELKGEELREFFEQRKAMYGHY